MDNETLSQVKRLCQIALNNTLGYPELDSLALSVGHHPDVLNAPPFDPEDVLRHMSEGTSSIRPSDWSVDQVPSKLPHRPDKKFDLELLGSGDIVGELCLHDSGSDFQKHFRLLSVTAKDLCALRDTCDQWLRRIKMVDKVMEGA